MAQDEELYSSQEAMGDDEVRSEKPSRASASQDQDLAGQGQGAGGDDNASVYSEAVSEHRSQPRSSPAASHRATSTAGSRLASETNFGGVAEDDDVNAASAAFSEAVSEHSHKPRSSQAHSHRYSSSRAASETNHTAEADGADPYGASTAFSDTPERHSKPRSSYHSHTSSHRLPSGTGGGGSRAQSEAHYSASNAGDHADEGHEASLAPSDAASNRRSKAPSAAAPSVQAHSRQASEAGGGRSTRPSGGVSGLSYDLTATGDLSFTDGGGAGKPVSKPASEAGGGRSARPSGGVSGLSYDLTATGDISLTDGGGATAKAPSKKPSEAGSARSARPSGMSGLSQDLTGVTGDISLGDGSGAKATSRQASEAGGARSARPSVGASGLSHDLGGTTADISYGDGGSTPTPPARRRSSLANSLRQSVAAASPSDSGEPEAAAAAATSGSYSQAYDDTSASVKPSSHHSGGASSVPASRPSASGVSVRSARSAAPSASGGGAARVSGDYSQSGFEEEEVPADEEEVQEPERPPRASDSVYSESVADGSESVASASLRGGSAKAPRASGSAVSGGSRRSGRSTQPPPAAVSEGDEYSQEEFDAGSASGAPSQPAAGETASGEAVAGPGADAAAVSGSILNTSHGGAGSIFQSHHSAAGGAPGGSVFRRLPADAPDDASLHSSPSAQPDGGADAAGDGSAPAGDWNEGAIRVPQIGARRPFGVRRDSSAPRPMSAAPRDRQAAQLAALTRKHPATWDPLDVAAWVDFLGLGQYRRRFLHHCIDGRLLLRLNDAQLKGELSIGPMGHRIAILEAAATLVKSYNEAQRDRPPEDAEPGAPGAEASRQEYRPDSAPRMRARPASAMPGGAVGSLSQSPPRAPALVPRRPASASRAVMPPDSHLGPGKGKVTVYEHRAKLLFELDRAQARAEQHRTLAEQLRHTAHMSNEEVAHLRGLLVDIEKKNRQAFGLSGGVDALARIPWRHVGNGTKHNNWHPERFARPGDPETVDLTFKPACPSVESKKLLSGGGGGSGGDYDASNAVNSFLDRLNNDLRKREQTRKELERRYYSDGSGGSKADADWAVVAEGLAGRCRIQLERDPAAYEAQIDEALGALSASESWREAGLKDKPIRAAKGPAKLAATASALRSLAFMERYRSDLKTRSSKISSLEKKWISQTLGDKYLPAARDKEDLAQAVQFFALLGWREDDGKPSEDAVAGYLLDRLLERAMEYRSRFDVWWERVRDRPQERAAGFRPDIDWNSPPWDTDGLTPPMIEEMERMAASAEEAATTTAQGGTLTRGPVELAPVSAGNGMDFVEFTVRLLGKCRLDDLRKMAGLGVKQKRLAVYRAIRTQKFIEYTERDLEERERKLRQAYTALAPTRRKIPSSRIESFFERLHEDGARRRARAEALAHEKMAKEREILASSVMYGRPRSAR